MEYLDLGKSLVEKISKVKAREFNLDYQDLKSHLLEKLIVKILPKITKDKKSNPKNFITKSLNGYTLNYKRDLSFQIKIPRSYKGLYMQEKNLKRKTPGITDGMIAVQCQTSIEKIKEMRQVMDTKILSLDNLEYEPQGDEDYFQEKYREELALLRNLPDEEFGKLWKRYVGD